MIRLCYDGTRYYGWNVQPNLPTIQGEVIEAVRRITGEASKVTGASRTDRGVHALGQVANFLTSSEIPAGRFKDALNSVLPPDIRVLDSWEAPIEFDARRSAIEKEYRYVIYQGELTPFMSNYAFCIRRRLNTVTMRKVAELFEGERDFANFTPERSGSTVRTIAESELRETGKFIVYRIRGRSFLRYMVRNIVGTLILVGLGKIGEDDVMRFLEPIVPARKIFTAPPHGLYLVEVSYPS